MEKSSLIILFISLILLLLIAAFFSASETSMMAINRYRLRHLVRAKNHNAIRVSQLLERPDRILGVILIGSTVANILAAAIATVIATHLWGDVGVMIATVLLTLVILIFAEITPKTLAAIYPLHVAFAASLSLKFFSKIFYPVVWFGNAVVNNMLTALRIKTRRAPLEHLTTEEMITLVSEAGDKIPDEHQAMMIAILGLEKFSVDDIMVPRHEIIGIDLENDWETILEQLRSGQHTRLPIYDGNIDNVKGMLHMRVALNLMAKGELTKKALLASADKAYFVPEGATLHQQLVNFRVSKQRTAFVVDEYGEILGLVTLEDILEEIVGEFTTDTAAIIKEAHLQPDGSYLVDGSANIRELNKEMHWDFDTSGPKTLGGLIIEYLEFIPSPGTSMEISGYPLEIVSVKYNRIHTVKVFPQLRKPIKPDHETED